MSFSSYEFYIFLPIVFTLYWIFQNKKVDYQNLLILIASYIFYGWWDYRFLSLIFISSFADFCIGLMIDKEDNQRQRKFFLFISIAINIGILGIFKYFNFFINSFANLISSFHLKVNIPSLELILPVGISFYTFQTLSYTIDIYKKNIQATNNPIAFFAFVSFFPQLVAGPIERAKNLLPQFLSKRSFDIEEAKDGLRQILWGLFKKVVVADNVAVAVNIIFDNYYNHSGIELFIGAFLFAIQIYGDFSGYSDIAIGTSKLFGFKLQCNFAYPYFSRDIAEFWRRWHISLSSWFRDYLFIPLGGSRTKTILVIRNIVITFVISGLWHGANWTFIFWGLLNGLYYIPLMLCGRHIQFKNDIVANDSLLPSLKEFFQIFTTFCMTIFAWIFFRAESLDHAVKFVIHMFSNNWFNISDYYIPFIFCGIFLLLLDWLHRKRNHFLDIRFYPVSLRWATYFSIMTIILIFGYSGQQDFIYFQF